MNEFDKITATEVRTIIAVLGFSFIMGFTFGDGSLGFTLMVGLLYLLGVFVLQYNRGHLNGQNQTITMVKRKTQETCTKRLRCVSPKKYLKILLINLRKRKLKYKDEIRRLEWNADEHQGGVEMFGAYGLKPLGQK